MTERSYKNLFSVADRNVLITGGIGILGRAYAAGFAENDAHLCIVDLDAAACEAFAAELSERYGVKALGIGTDITQPEAVADMVRRAENDLGPLDFLLNNAATKGDDFEAFFARPEDYSLKTWREVMAVNLDGMFLVAQQVGGRMAQRGRGSIVQVASIYGILGPDASIYEGSEYRGRPINTPPIYSASKAGVIGLTRYLATYWAPRGVRVNALTPGGVESGQNEVFKRRYAAKTPMGRMARREEMVGAALFLASDASSYMTGQNLVIDGGWSVW